MEITLVGTGCGVPSLRRGPSAILMREGNDLLLLDSGPGSLRKMLEIGVTYKDIDYILYTHFHIDHIGELGAIIFATKYELESRTKDLTIIGPKGMRRFYEKLIDLYGSQIQNLPYNVNIVEPEGKFSTKNWELTILKTTHTPESIGYRIKGSNGKVVVYPGDTEFSPSLPKFIEDADMLIIECSFPTFTPGHLYPDKVGEIAQSANVKWLVITHLYPVCEDKNILSAIRSKFDGKLTVGEDLMQLTL